MDATLAIIIAFAEKRDNIRYVIQNGSRVNPNFAIDEYADYDIVFGCENSAEYRRNQDWIKGFGKLLIGRRGPYPGACSGKSYNIEQEVQQSSNRGMDHASTINFLSNEDTPELALNLTHKVTLNIPGT